MPNRDLAERVEQTQAAHKAGQTKTMDEWIHHYLPDIVAAMPTDVRDRLQESFGRLALNTLRWNPGLRRCDVPSVIGALMKVAALGLEPPDGDRPDNLVYFVPRNVNVGTRKEPKWLTRVQVMIDYRGLIELAQRTGGVAEITADVVYEHDDVFDYWVDERGQHLKHKPAGLLVEDPGRIIGAYARAEMANGSTIIEVVRRSVLDRAKGASELGRKDEGPWADAADAMARKTAVRQLFKWLPKTPRSAAGFALDGQVVNEIPSEPLSASSSPILDVVSDDEPDEVLEDDGVDRDFGPSDEVEEPEMDSEPQDDEDDPTRPFTDEDGEG